MAEPFVPTSARSRAGPRAAGDPRGRLVRPTTRRPPRSTRGWMSSTPEVDGRATASTASAGDGPLITDDLPRPEYFLLRRLFGDRLAEALARASCSSCRTGHSSSGDGGGTAPGAVRPLEPRTGEARPAVGVARGPRPDEREHAQPDRQERPLVERERGDAAGDRDRPRAGPSVRPRRSARWRSGSAPSRGSGPPESGLRRRDVGEHEPDPLAPRAGVDEEADAGDRRRRAEGDPEAPPVALGRRTRGSRYPGPIFVSEGNRPHRRVAQAEDDRRPGSGAAGCRSYRWFAPAPRSA